MVITYKLITYKLLLCKVAVIRATLYGLQKSWKLNENSIFFFF